MGERQEREQENERKWQEDWARMSGHEKIKNIKEKAGVNMQEMMITIKIKPRKPLPTQPQQT